jgi:hypothetical protein
LGTLYSYLKNKGIPVDVHHAYLRCAEILDPELYRGICHSMRDEIFYPYFLYPENFLETPVKKLTKPTEQKVYHQIVWA